MDIYTSATLCPKTLNPTEDKKYHDHSLSLASLLLTGSILLYKLLVTRRISYLIQTGFPCMFPVALLIPHPEEFSGAPETAKTTITATTGLFEHHSLYITSIQDYPPGVLFNPSLPPLSLSSPRHLPGLFRAANSIRVSCCNHQYRPG